ncbi:MAG: S-adenosylmethionine:tRNA ribosyltransferase-isomerase [Candidatus Kapabacteria bacterium]|nr:S-adenosylmethionine:tRNA ribosyltransferase-isomerase [Candidatus Kapabacteria bacterium]
MTQFSNIPDIFLSDYDYLLPKDKIAEYPLPDRSDSKLLFADLSLGEIGHHIFKEITDFIPKDSHLILNSTKVISARLNMMKPSGGKCELLLIDPVEPSKDPAIVMSAYGKCKWNCMIGGRKVVPGLELRLSEQDKYDFKALVVSRYQNYGEIEFSWQTSSSFSEVLSNTGDIPLPPYIERNTEESDKERYQTVYADIDGSVAAPTAGLHFTPDILNIIKNNGTNISELILHVGPGTFLPISSDSVREHEMHDEMIVITKETVESIIGSLRLNKNIIAVGTTSVRSLESLYWAGLKYILGFTDKLDNFSLQQDEPYQLSDKSLNIPALDSFNEILKYMNENNLNYITGRTKLFIMPVYDFKTINGIITNFHLPKSTLILLVAAFTGKEMWRRIYNEAADNNYRFLSYGDSSFLFLPKLNK